MVQSGNNTLEYGMELFDKAFSDFKDKKIAVYGTGPKTAELILEGKEYNIVGICDRDESLIGQKMYGKTVLSREEVEKAADILIINTSKNYWNTIYKRIREWRLPIYFWNGELAHLLENEYEDNDYWNTSYDEMVALVNQYEVISFDIFDTLLMRRVMSPDDVFRIVEKWLKASWKDISFLHVRNKAISLLSENYTFDEIYEKIAEITDLSAECIEYAKECEIKVEKSLILPRENMCHLCNELIKNKEVYFISDMYLSRDILCEFLMQIGINVEKDKIIVSCEAGKNKRNGDLWTWYKKNLVNGRKAIHIGDNVISDVKRPVEYGIDSYRIMSAFEMLENSSIRDIVPHIWSLQSSLAMGIIVSKMFNNPFALNITKGKISFSDNKCAGYCIFGNVIYNFMIWLINHTKNEVEQILFFAREAYLLLPEYEYMCSLLGDCKLPKGIYVEISRRAIWGSTVQNMEDIYEYAGYPYVGNAEDFFRERFGIDVRDTSLKEIDVYELQKNKESFCNLLKKYENEILENFRYERNNYLNYIKSLHLKENFVVVDSFYNGSIQYYLEKLLEKKTTGYYFCAFLDKANKFFTGNNMKGCFQKKSDATAEKSAMKKNALFLESFFTAPWGMLKYIDEKLIPRYAEGKSNQEFFDVRNSMQEGIFMYLSEMVTLQKDLDLSYMLDEDFADVLYGYFLSDGYIPTEAMKNSFYVDDALLYERETQLL